MAMSSRPDHFFQTTSSLAENDRKLRKSANTQGSPVKFQSKLLAIGVNHYYDAAGDAVFVAEAAGTIKGLRLSTNDISKAPNGPMAPLTSLAFHANRESDGSLKTMRIYAGCWDKSVWSYVSEATPVRGPNEMVTECSSFGAHADFIKCLLVARTPDQQDIIISGGADGDIKFWTIDGEALGGIKPQSRGIESLALDPFSAPQAPVVFFSTSQREIYQFVLPDWSKLNATHVRLSDPIIAHETSVYRLHFDGDGDLWTASADKTAKRLVRESNWQVDTVLQHPDFVRDVVTHDQYGWVITACRDEEVRVWNRSTGALHHVFSGHFEEVTGLAISGDLVLSISIDATLRRWSLSPRDLGKAIEEAKNPQLLSQDPEPSNDLGMLTAEEEAELTAMMEAEEADALEKMAMGEQ